MVKTTPQPFWKGSVFQLSALVILAIIAIGLYLHHLNQPGAVPVNTTVIGTAANETRLMPKVTTKVKNGTVRHYASAIKSQLKLPAEIVADDNQLVLDSIKVKGDDHPYTITPVLDDQTGETKTLVRRDPLPWIAWDDHGKLGMYGGYKNGQPTVRIEAEQGIFQVKAVHFGVTGSVDQEINPPAGQTGTEYFVGGGAWYRW